MGLYRFPARLDLCGLLGGNRMNLHYNYLTNFWDIHLDLERERQVSYDFIVNCTQFLVNIGVRAPYPFHTAQMLYRSMMHRGVHYHTPLHVLRMFAVAQDMGCHLSDSEILAIWFHDAFWRPDKGVQNEINSGCFLLGLLEGLVAQPILEMADQIVQDTALYLQPQVNETSRTVMDLDLAHFALPDYPLMGELVRREFLEIYTEEEVRTGRRAFLEKALATKPLYRTIPFRERFEEKARQNLEKDLQELTA